MFTLISDLGLKVISNRYIYTVYLLEDFLSMDINKDLVYWVAVDPQGQTSTRTSVFQQSPSKSELVKTRDEL